MLGTLLGGTVYAALSPMTLREGLAISAGFGWYTMAPSVIASAGHTIASAVSFLHNVLREMLGIILLPVIAGKIGYIEAITILAPPRLTCACRSSSRCATRKRSPTRSVPAC